MGGSSRCRSTITFGWGFDAGVDAGLDRLADRRRRVGFRLCKCNGSRGGQGSYVGATDATLTIPVGEPEIPSGPRRS